MEEFKNEIVVYTGVCRCCLKENKANDFMGLWDQHLYEGNVEVYGEMIMECFLMPWAQPNDPEANVEQICLDCVLKVREAFSFRQQLQAIEENLSQQFEQEEWNVEESTPKEVQVVEEYVYTDRSVSNNEDQAIYTEDNSVETLEDSEPEYEEIEFIEDDYDIKNNKENLVESLEDSKPEYEDIEYVEDDYDVNNYKDEIEMKSPVRKKVSPKTTRDNSRIVKNYRPIDMDDAVRCCLEGTMTHAQAAASYNVPRKTVYAKVKKIKRQKEEERLRMKSRCLETSQGDVSNIRLNGLIGEIMKILTYTNATPFKTTTSSFGCVYCNFLIKATTFDDPETLRAHTRVEHADERIQAVQIFMKPNLYNEVLKVDIYNLVCTVCCEVISGWMGMFEHLHKVHDVVLDEAYTRVIPYVLDISSHKCAICKEKFHNYHLLDSHINCHYNNYVCEECGDSFLTHTRIKMHMKVHNVGKFACDFPGCSKVFNLKKYRRKHYMMMHTDEKLVKCHYCDMKFHDRMETREHVKQQHKEKVAYITCDLCGMVFDWKINYITHMKTRHKVESFKCKYCGVLCTSKAVLRKHLKIHGDMGIKCDVCKKSFLAVRYMKQHKRQIHGISSSRNESK